MDKIQKAINNINVMKNTHICWAEYFEANPDIEKEYIDTGVWDGAKEHRNIINQYNEVLDILEKINKENG